MVFEKMTAIRWKNFGSIALKFSGINNLLKELKIKS